MRNLITPQEVIDLAFAENSNMMADSISATAIRVAEIKYIRPAFGVMYPLLADKYADFTNNYVKPALAYFVKSEIISSIAIDMSNSGVAIANPQYQSAATDKQRQRLYDSVMANAKTLLDFALSYIVENKDLFPDFNGEAPKKHHRIGGLLLPNGKGSAEQSASITGDAFKAEFDKYIKEMGEISEEVSDLVESTSEITEKADAAAKSAEEATKSATTAITNAEKATKEATTAANDANVATEEANEATANANEAAQRANNEVENLKDKADTDGYYPDMSVGMADNLVGRGDVQDAQINFRPSADADNISDGAARIERIKGNSVVWNQGNENNTRKITDGGLTMTFDNNGTFNIKGTFSASSMINLYDFYNSQVTAGHKYLFLISHILAKHPQVAGIYIYGTFTGKLHTQDAFLEASNSGRSNSYIRIVANNGDVVDITDYAPIIDLTQMFGAGNEPITVEEYRQRKPMNIEDEFAYNAGTLVDMKVDSLISTSDNAYDYTKERARVMGGHTYDCSYGTAFVEKVYFSTDKDNIAAEENAMASNNGKYTFPSDGYAVPYTMNGDVREYCVCLQHTYTKPHPPYQQVVKDLSFIGEAFPEGMRLIPPMTFPNSAVVANVDGLYDEIFFDKTIKKWKKVQRIGVAYAKDLVWGRSGNNLFSALIADLKRPTTYEERREGILMNKYSPSYSVAVNALDDKSFIRLNDTKNVFIRNNEYDVAADFAAANQDLVIYYELAEPIVEEIDLSPNFNLDYFAWDFGTEEAIASTPSAPFRADINYEPNAVDDLRWAVSEIRSLRAELAQLQSAQASETNLTE